MIELFKKLDITADLTAFQCLRAILVASVRPPWSYLSDREFTATPGGRFVIFGYRNGNYPDSDLWLAWHGGKATISNIVPVEMRRLSKTQYNGLLDSFFDEHLKTAAERLQLKVSVSKGHREIAEWIGPEAMRRLEMFSAMAPKASINHPMDRERWMDFVIAVQKNTAGDHLPSDALERWLIGEGWPEVFAEELAAEYSNVIEWLDRYAIAS